MKKTISSLVLLGLCVTAFSQTFIPKAGISLANVALSDDIKELNSPIYDDTKSKTGFVIGLGVEFGFTDLFAIQPELLFHQKGFKVDYSEQGATYTETNTLNYIELPVMAKVKFGKLYANAGPVIGFGIGGSYEFEFDDGQGTTFSESGKIKFGEEPDNYTGDDSYVDNGFEFGVAVGAGYKLLGKILIDVRYGIGLSSLQDDESGYDFKSTNNSLQFTVGLPLGGN